MYGFSGYGTNSYGSQRQSIIAQVIKLGARIMQNVYGRALTFIRPSTRSQTMQLPT